LSQKVKSIGNFGILADRYRHTYQSRTGINACSDDTMLESGKGRSEVNWGRKESAHAILKILSKLDTPWMRDAKRLPGWGDEL
jgi:hypothetical protein